MWIEDTSDAERYCDFGQTQLAVYKERGWFGDCIANSNFVSGVGTNFLGLAIAGAYQAGIRGYDINLAYQAIKANELDWKNRNPGSGKMDLRAFVERGFVPYLNKNKTDSTGSNYSASHTLEYSFSTFAAAQLAKALGKPADYQHLIGYSDGWKKLFDPKLKLIRPKKADGTFIDNFDPNEPLSLIHI